MAITTNLFAAVGGYHGRAGQQGRVGIFTRRADEGVWHQKIGEQEGFCVVVDPRNPLVVFAGTTTGIHRSVDGGSTFQRMAFPFEGVSVWSFLFDQSDPKVMYAGGSPIMVYRSGDGGTTWAALPNSTVPDPAENLPFKCRVMRLVQHPTRPATIFAALEVNGVIRTDDRGETWSNCSEDLVRLAQQPHLKSSKLIDNDAEGMLDMHAVAISPVDPDRVIAAGRLGLFASEDEGRSWADMEVGRFAPTTYARDLRISEGDPTVLYVALSVAAASHQGGVYRSRDTGRTWSRFDAVEVTGTVMSIALKQSDPDCVFLAARYNGEIFGTEDAGRTWQAVTMPDDVKDIYAIAAS